MPEQDSSVNVTIRVRLGCVEVITEGSDRAWRLNPESAKYFAHSLRVAAIEAEKQMPTVPK